MHIAAVVKLEFSLPRAPLGFKLVFSDKAGRSILHCPVVIARTGANAHLLFNSNSQEPIGVRRLHPKKSSSEHTLRMGIA
jgi:hypothetical protein